MHPDGLAGLASLTTTAIAAVVLMAACATLSNLGIDIGVEDVVNARTVAAAAEAARPLTDEEEYFVGRAVAARILGQTPLHRDRELTNYLNLMGSAIVFHSDRPVTFGGYHFAVLDDDGANAFASPGGTILVTRGMIDSVESEDELAAVLAHEVAHVANKHGLKAIQSSRLTKVAGLIGESVVSDLDNRQLAELVGAFDDSINDIVETLVVNGYGRTQESEADRDAIEYLARAGYDPYALLRFLQRIAAAGAGSESGLISSHPATADRVRRVERELRDRQATTQTDQLTARTARFRSAVGR